MGGVTCIWPIAAELGEGPCWSAPEGALWFVDIKAKQIHRFAPATGAKQSWPAPDQVGFVLPRDDGSFVVGLPGRLARFTPATGKCETLAILDREPAGNRLNDACIDAGGRLWFGSMDDAETKPHGALYCWDGAAAPIARDPGYVISNGPAFSPDGRTFYHTDTVRRTLYRFDVAADGSISGKRPLVEIEKGAGWPDGTTVDAEGSLWVALYGGGAVRRYSPEGELRGTVSLPCANVTKLAFGGPDLRTAFVTTARKGLGPGELAGQPLAGGLFAFESDTPGIAGSSMAASPKAHNESGLR